MKLTGAVSRTTPLHPPPSSSCTAPSPTAAVGRSHRATAGGRRQVHRPGQPAARPRHRLRLHRQRARADPGPGPGRRPLLRRRGDHQRRHQRRRTSSASSSSPASPPRRASALIEVEGTSRDSALAPRWSRCSTRRDTARRPPWSSPSTRQASMTSFAADLPAQQTAMMAATQRPVAESAFAEPSGPPAWKPYPPGP